MNETLVRASLEAFIDEIENGATGVPAYEGSPIEEQFLYEYSKVASERIILSREVEVSTAAGHFRMDFVISDHTGKIIGVECDGKDSGGHGSADGRRLLSVLRGHDGECRRELLFQATDEPTKIPILSFEVTFHRVDEDAQRASWSLFLDLQV